MATGDPNPLEWQMYGCRMGHMVKTWASDHTEVSDNSWQWFEPEPSRTTPPNVPYVPPVFPQPYYPMDVTMKGWECPRCHRINAPSVSQCTCGPKAKDANDVSNGAPQT